jgi:16S rRNA A1518/A1519 N6-dimethyltransferase RsmA/KsgA/DIM1 with predicted DNA glycosylase/AP lyase activity
MELRLTGSRSGSTSTSSRSPRPSGRARPPVRAKKRFGQHFLSDINILNRIVDAADIALDEIVLEVGPGLGGLTAVLAERARRVVAVEVDRDLITGLRARFADVPHVTIVEGDVLELSVADVLGFTRGESTAEPQRTQKGDGSFTTEDTENTEDLVGHERSDVAKNVGLMADRAPHPQPLSARQRGEPAGPYVVVANLPYNIAAPALRRFLEGDVRPRRLVVMVQLEVAEAIVAKPGRMSLMSVATQVYGDTQMVMKVAPGAFSPPPKVDSAVVRIDVATSPKVDVPIDAFFRIVRAGFGNPRKQLRNSLSFGLHVKQEIIDGVMTAAGVDATLRPQVLSLDDWAAITRAWEGFTAEPQSAQRGDG